MSLPRPEVLGLMYGISETIVFFWKRSRRETTSADDGSLRVLWGVIMASIAMALIAAKTVPSASFTGFYLGGVIVFFGGIVLRWCAIIYLGRFFTVDVALALDHRVIDAGPYRFIRHPAYAGALLAFLGFGLCLSNWLSLVLLLLPIMLAFLRRMRIEEAALTSALGEAYRAYMWKTKRLIPFIY